MSLPQTTRAPAPDQAGEHGLASRGRGIRRSVELVRLFRAEQAEPDRYYSNLAQDTARQIEDYGTFAGQTVLDIGGGGGYFSAAFAARGATCVVIEPDPAELRSRGTVPAGAILADGCALPVRDGGADICFSSNVLEHVADPAVLISEMIRATRPGGLIYLSFTNWYSPWGGHEMSPWHYLGAGYAERRYVRHHGHPPKNRYGSGLYPVHIGAILRLLRSRADVEVVDALPRYYPPWCRPVLRIPGVREVVTWNLLTILRRRG
jgi:SAM-dependent methyltransferase